MKKEKMKTVYLLRVRINDNSEWSTASYYKSKRRRDKDAIISHIIGGFRTYCSQENKTLSEIKAIDFN